MEKVFNVGVLGCGQIAQIMHLPYLHDSNNFQIVALCDISKTVVTKVGEKYSLPSEKCYLDLDAFLADKDIEVVLICSKDHCEPVIKAAQAKKHIFVEKPFGFSLEQSIKMANSAKENNVLLMVGYMKRHDTSYEYFLENIKSMENINLVRVHDFGGSFDYTKTVFDVITGDDVPKEALTAGGKEIEKEMLKEIGVENKHLLKAYSLLLGVFSHDLVLLRHAFGNNPEVVFSQASESGLLVAVLKYGDIQCVLESGLVMDRRIWDESFTVYSGKKNITLSFPWPYLKNAPTELLVSDTIEGTTMPRESIVRTSFHEAYRNEWIHFYDCLINNKIPLTNGDDAVEDMRLAQKIINAAK